MPLMKLAGFFVVCVATLATCQTEDGEITQTFNSWFKEHAVLSDKVEVGDYGTLGRGIRVLKPIKKGELVMSFPTVMSLTPEAARASVVGPYLTPNAQTGTPACVVMLMWEKAHISESKWRPWIDALPQKFTSAVTFTDREIGELENQAGEMEIKQARSSMREDFEALKSTIFAPHPKMFPTSSFNWETYQWARLVVDSRCWTMKGRRLCVPGADFFNYGVSEEQLDPNSNLMGNFFVDYHKLGQRSSVETVDIYSDRDAAVGEQLLEAYGESNNLFLATWFGFAPIPNPSDSIELRWQFQPGRGFHSEEKLKMLNLFQGAVQATFKLRKLDVLPDNVIWYLKVTTLPADLMKKCSQQHSKASLIKCMDGHNTAAMYDELLELLQEKLDRYSTTVAKDAQLLDAPDISPQRRLIITTRMHWKMIAEHNSQLAQKLAAAAGGRRSQSDEL